MSCCCVQNTSQIQNESNGIKLRNSSRISDFPTWQQRNMVAIIIRLMVTQLWLKLFVVYSIYFQRQKPFEETNIYVKLQLKNSRRRMFSTTERLTCSFFSFFYWRSETLMLSAATSRECTKKWQKNGKTCVILLVFFKKKVLCLVLKRLGSKFQGRCCEQQTQVDGCAGWGKAVAHRGGRRLYILHGVSGERAQGFVLQQEHLLVLGGLPDVLLSVAHKHHFLSTEPEITCRRRRQSWSHVGLSRYSISQLIAP